MKKIISGKYKTIRFLFGLLLTMISLKNLTHSFDENVALVDKNIKSMISNEGIIGVWEFDFVEYRDNYKMNIDNVLNFSHMDNNIHAIVYSVNLMFLIGGILCMFGYQISKFFLVNAILFDLILIHNLRFFMQESGKGTMIKMVAFLGGALHIV